MNTCQWTEHMPDESYWETSCGEAFVFLDGDNEDLSTHKFRFCPYCGKPIEAIPYVEELEAEEE